MIHHNPGLEGSTAGDQTQQNITATIYRASVASVKWDVCTEILKDNTHPATDCSSYCLLTTHTEVSANIPPDYRAASLLRLWRYIHLVPLILYKLTQTAVFDRFDCALSSRKNSQLLNYHGHHEMILIHFISQHTCTSTNKMFLFIIFIQTAFFHKTTAIKSSYLMMFPSLSNAPQEKCC